MATPEHSSERQKKIQRQLDEALAESFPASDPVSIVTSQNEEAWEEPATAADSQEHPPKERAGQRGE